MQRRFPRLKPPDASHLASAIIANVDEMHTFDSDLLDLDGKVQRTDGADLKKCKPSMGGPPLPLLESPAVDNADDKGQGSDEDSPAAEGDGVTIRAGGAGTGLPGGRSGVREGTEADSGGGTSTEASAEDEEQKLTEDQMEALEDEENIAELNKLEPPPTA